MVATINQDCLVGVCSCWQAGILPILKTHKTGNDDDMLMMIISIKMMLIYADQNDDVMMIGKSGHYWTTRLSRR